MITKRRLLIGVVAATISATLSAVPAPAIAEGTQPTDDNLVEATVTLPDVSFHESWDASDYETGSQAKIALTLTNTGRVNANALYIRYRLSNSLTPTNIQVASGTADIATNENENENEITIRTTLKPREATTIAVDATIKNEGEITNSLSWGQAYPDETPATMADVTNGLATVTTWTATQMSDVSITADKTFVYDGTAKIPAITVSHNGQTLVEGTDYVVRANGQTDVGHATATISGVGRYTGSVTIDYEVLPRDISKAGAKCDNAVWDGSQMTPNIAIFENGIELVQNKDYSVTYLNNTDPGTATAIAEGKGNYTGKRKIAFSITCPMAKVSISVPSGETYDGHEKTPKIVAKLAEKTLKENDDYSLKYANNTDAGTATVTVIGKGCFTGSASTTFKIAKATPTITANDITMPFGSKRSLSTKVTGNGKLTYKSANTKVATVDAKGNVTGITPGTTTVTIYAAASKNYTATSKSVKVTIQKKANPMKVTTSKKKISKSKIKSKAQVVKAIAVTSAQGKLTFKKQTGSANLAINKSTGAVTVRKGSKAGTYTAKVAVKAAGNTKYLGATKSVVVTITVK